MKIFLHFGIHKSGSTFMQQSFFPSLEGIDYCHCGTRHRQFIDYLLHADDLEFQPEHARGLFDQTATLDGSGPVVVSNEMFYAPLMWNRYTHRRRGCDRLAAVFPEGHAAIVLRNQRDLLESLYGEFVANGGTSSWPQFLRNQVASGYLHYGSYIIYLRECFGRENVSVFFYEDFVSDPTDYLEKWCDMFGVSPAGWKREITMLRNNPSISPSLLPFLRLANRFVSSKRHPELVLPRSLHKLLRVGLLRCSTLFKKTSRSSYPENEIMRDLLDGCREGNRAIADLVDRDLTELGYPY